MNGHHHEQAPRGHIRNRPSSRTTASAAASAASAAAQLVERAQMMSAAADRMRFGSGPSQHAASMQWQQLYAGRNAAPAPRPFGTLVRPLPTPTHTPTPARARTKRHPPSRPLTVVVHRSPGANPREPRRQTATYTTPSSAV
jgi:hypothetical protein